MINNTYLEKIRHPCNWLPTTGAKKRRKAARKKHTQDVKKTYAGKENVVQKKFRQKCNINDVVKLLFILFNEIFKVGYI